MSVRSLDSRVGLALAVATVASIGLLAVGVAAMVAGGVQPLGGPPSEFDPGRLGSDLASGRTKPSGRPRFSRIFTPRMRAELAASRALIAGVPRLPSSPRVISMMPVE